MRHVFWRQSQRRCQQRIDLRVAVDIGLRTLQSRQDADGRHLRLRIDVRDVAREAAHVGQPQRPGRMPIGRQRRPLYRQLRGDGRGTALLHEGDEVGEPSGLVLVLVSQPFAHAQISIECGTQTAHCNLQRDSLRAAGLDKINEDRMSGAKAVFPWKA